MNSLLRITIQIAVKQAEELAALVKTIEGLGAKGKKSASGLKAVADAVKETAKGSKAVQEAQKKILDNQKAIDSASRKIIGNMRNVVEQFKRNMMSAEEAAKRIDELSSKGRRDPKGRFMKAQPDVVAASRKALDDIEKITQRKIKAEESQKIDSIKRVLAMEETGRMRSFAARRAVSKLSEGAAPGSTIDIAKARAYRTLDARESSRISKQQRDDQQRLNSAINSMTSQMSKTMEEFRNGLIDSEAASKRIKAIWQTPNADPALQGKIAEAGTVGRQAKINLAKIESAKIKAIKKEEIDYLNGIYKQYVNGQISYDQMVLRSKYNAAASSQATTKAGAEENIRKASISRLKAFTAEAAGIESRYNQKKIGFNEAQAQLARISEGIEKTHSENVTLQAKARTRTLDAINAINLKNEKSHLDQLKSIENDYVKGKLSYIKALSAAGAVKGATPYASVKGAANQTMLSLTATREVKLHQEATSQIEDLRRKHYSRLISYADAHQEINKIVKGYLGGQASAQKVADDAAIARLKMRNIEEERLVRQHMEEIRLIRMRAATGMVTMDDAKSKLSAIGGMYAPGSKVNVQAASEIKRIADAEKAAANATDLLNGSASRQKRSIADLGKNMMWTGRQLEYTFTLPIWRAGKALYELQKQSSIQVTRIAKVYGDATGAANSFSESQYALGKSLSKVSASQQTDSYKLGKGFRYLSDGMGVQIDQVEEIAAKWAAAGYQGGALLKATKMTMEAMTVGDMANVEDAFKALIQVKQGYKLTLEQTTRALAILNKTENITAASFQDLTDGFARSASAASQAGIKVEELAGMLAVLVPAAGSAETVGQALKTLISRVMDPTDAFKEDLAEVGIAWNETFSSMTATQRLETLAKAFANLSDAQKSQLNKTYAGRYQLNKASLLMEDIALSTDAATRSQSTFAKVVDASGGSMEGGTDAMQTYTEEIQKFLDSPAGRIAILKTRIQNLGNEIFARLMPIFEKILTYVLTFLTVLDRIGPKGKKFLLIGIAFLALLGPISRVIGAFGIFGQVIGWAVKGVVWLAGVLGIKTATAVAGSAAETAAATAATAATWASVLPWIAVIAAIVATIAIIWIFRDEIGAALSSAWQFVKKTFTAIFNFIGSVFWALPGVVQAALFALVRNIQVAVKAAWEALQYLNPFMRHSPSLVDNVKAGVDEIARQYARLSNIGNIYSDAAAKLREFGKATESIRTGSMLNERSKQMNTIQEQNPELGPLAGAVWTSMDQLTEAMGLVKIEIEAQAEVVAKLEVEYKALGKVLDEAEYKLKKLERTSSLLREQMDAAKTELSDWASRPIEGSKQLSDALFENEMAQKRLRLEMMKIEDTYGSIDDVKNKMALLAGEIEQLQALQTNLRESGAGSEITDPIQQKIAQLRAESAALSGSGGGSQISKLEEELKRLQREAERLDLEGALKFDPLKRQIEELANVTREATFEEIVAGMAAARAKIDELTPGLSLAEEAVRIQQISVDELRTAHDELGYTFDIEKSKLDDLVGAYDGLKSMYEDLQGIMDDIVGKLENISDAAVGASDSLASGDWEQGAKNIEELFNLDDEIARMEKKLEDFVSKWKGKWDTFVNHLQTWLSLAISGGLTMVITGIVIEFAWDTIAKIGNMFVGVWNWVVTLIEGQANGLIDALNVIAGKIGMSIPNLNLGWAKLSVFTMNSPDYGKDPTWGQSAYSLHTGGVVPGVLGSDVPTVLQAGEGVLSIKMMRLIDRAIAQPEQSMASNSSSGKTINFYGDLSFPNITGPDEAEQFIRNLEAMAAS